MPRIISFGNIDPKDFKENPIKELWEWFTSLDKFTKIFLVTLLLFAVFAAYITTNLLNTVQHAQEIVAGSTGYFEKIDTNSWTLVGWAYNPSDPTTPVNVDVYMEKPTGTGYLLGNYTANGNRPDLPAAGIPANHGFVISIPDRLRSNYHKFYIYAVYTDGTKHQLLNSAGNNDTMGTQPNGDSQISATVLGKTLTITTTDRFGGAISSLVWGGQDGQEFINSFDHGREMQTAMELDLLGECYNPTEAGGAYDGSGNTSSSVLNYISTVGNSLTTISSPAYWLRPGISYVNPISQQSHCGGRQDGIDTAQNTSLVSDYFIRKDVKIGFQGISNVIEYSATASIPRNHTEMTIEAVTGYIPAAFSNFYTYDPKTSTLAVIANHAPGSPAGSVPVILATSDNQNAMGVYSPELRKAPNLRYDVRSFNLPGAGNSTSKWDCIFHEGGSAAPGGVPAGDYNYKCYIIVGTLSDVTTSMTKLYGILYQSPTGSITASPNPCSISPNARVCTSTLSWNTQNATNVTVKLAQTGQVIAGGISGSDTVSWIGTSTTTFILTENNNELGRVNVTGARVPTSTPPSTPVPTNTPTPTPSPIPVSPNYDGYFDQVTCAIISGWAADRNRLTVPINVDIYSDGTFLTSVTANGKRPDVGTYLGDSGLHGFKITTPASLNDSTSHTITVKYGGTTKLLGTNSKKIMCAP